MRNIKLKIEMNEMSDIHIDNKKNIITNLAYHQAVTYSKHAEQHYDETPQARARRNTFGLCFYLCTFA
jgi:hypothetical protein